MKEKKLASAERLSELRLKAREELAKFEEIRGFL